MHTNKIAIFGALVLSFFIMTTGFKMSSTNIQLVPQAFAAELENEHITPTLPSKPKLYHQLAANERKQIDCLAKNIYYEAGYEPRLGWNAVAAVTMNRVLSGNYADTVCGVVYQKTGQASPDMFDQEMFHSIRPLLDRIDNIHCLETPLYSHHLKVAGTVDCIAEFDGKLTVIDFKTASKPKQRDWIHDYFMQTSAYAVAFEELTGIPVGRLTIIMGVDNSEPLLFQEKRNDWIFEFRKLRDQFKRAKGV